jgi:hypothetical protein
MTNTPKAAPKAASASRARGLDWQLNFDRLDEVENRGRPVETLDESNVDDASLATAILHANTSKLTEERKVFLNYLERSLEEIGNAACDPINFKVHNWHIGNPPWWARVYPPEQCE